jgi:hypothetical protein
MNRNLLPFLAAAGLAAANAAAQGSALFTTSLPERTLSGSGGTVLEDLWPNEVASLDFFPCPVISAEKWAPRTCYHTMAGDDNSDTQYWKLAVFGSIDALCDVISPLWSCPNQRTIYWSPSAPLGTGVSGLPGLRPGDTGRIVKNGPNDGQIEYLLRAEEVQQALGMSTTNITVDVDAIAVDPGYGIFFSLDQDTVVNTTCGVTFVRDGDVLCIPPGAITWVPGSFLVQTVVPGSAEVVYSEAQMTAFVLNAQVNDHLGNCVTQIQDLESLEFDYAGPVQVIVSCATLFVPTLIFSGELMTGASLLDTANSGQIHVAGCGPIGHSCGTTPTSGLQMGLRPPTNGNGVPSYVNAYASLQINHRFVIEPKQPQFLNGNAAQIDVNTPGVLTWVFLAFAPGTLPNSVAPSIPFPPNSDCYFPDLYILPPLWWGNPPTGFSTLVTPPIPWPCKLVCQGVSILGSGGIVLGTPAMLDVF